MRHALRDDYAICMIVCYSERSYSHLEEIHLQKMADLFNKAFLEGEKGCVA